MRLFLHLVVLAMMISRLHSASRHHNQHLHRNVSETRRIRSYLSSMPNSASVPWSRGSRSRYVKRHHAGLVEATEIRHQISKHAVARSEIASVDVGLRLPSAHIVKIRFREIRQHPCPYTWSLNDEKTESSVLESRAITAIKLAT